MAAILVVAFLAASSAVPASATTCSTEWGSLPETATASTTGHLTAVRTGRHACFDRLVIDHDGDPAGYRVEYVDRLTADGSGNSIAIEGGAILRIVTTAPGYDADGRATIDPGGVDATDVGGYQTFRDVGWAGSFEGQTTIGLGVRARLPFRVFSLDGPGDGSRLVIDVAHRWSQADSPADPAGELPGDHIVGPARPGDLLAVMGVASDDVLNIRSRPGVDHPIVATAAPTAADLVATGRARALTRSIWYEVTVGETTGWANARYLGFLGGTDDVTAAFLDGRPYPAAETMTDLGALVATEFASEDPPSSIVVAVAPTVGDLGEVTYDVIGLGDDSVAGVRLHIFATPHDSGDGFVLRTIEATSLCARGSDGTTCA